MLKVAMEIRRSLKSASASELAFHLEHETSWCAIPIAKLEYRQSLVVAAVENIVEVQRCRPVLVERICRAQIRDQISALVKWDEAGAAVYRKRDTLRNMVCALGPHSPTHAPTSIVDWQPVIGPQFENAFGQLCHIIRTGVPIVVVGIPRRHLPIRQQGSGHFGFKTFALLRLRDIAARRARRHCRI